MKRGLMQHQPFKMDFHTHSHYSPDANAHMKDMIDAAIKNGITDLAFTDHVDLDADLEHAPQNWDFDRDDFFSTLNTFKTQYMGQIHLYHGLEIGIQPHLSKENRLITRANPYDFIIASLHAVERHDLYHRTFFKHYDAVQAVRKYYTDLLTCIETFDDFSVIGHLDLYLRYKPELAQVKLDAYKDLIIQIYKRLIESGKGLEINAGGFRYDLGHFNPHDDLLKLYREMNGEILTYGSDAHSTDFIGKHYEDAINRLKNIGFNYLTTFRNLKPIFHKI